MSQGIEDVLAALSSVVTEVWLREEPERIGGELQEFLTWIADLTEVQKLEVASSAGLTVDQFSALVDFLHSSGGLILVARYWQQMLVSNRTEPAPVESVSCVFLVRYADGSVFPTQTFATRETVGEPFCDPMVSGLVTQRAVETCKLIAEHGLAGLHKMAEQVGATAPGQPAAIEIILGLVLRALPQIPDLATRTRVEKMMRTIQAVFLPKVPPEAKAAIAERLRKQAAAPPPNPGPPRTQGGWDFGT